MEFVKQLRGVYLLGLVGLLAVACGASDEPTGATSVVVLAQNVGDATPPFSREQRLSRFIHFLTKRKEALLLQGATRQGERPALAGWYARTSLLDPRVVTNRLSYAVNRYDSYLERISAQMVSENLVPRSGSLTKPASFVKPEDFGPITGNATAAFKAALAAGNVWLTPDTIYVLTETIDIPSTRQIISDGSGILHFKTGPGTAFTAMDVTSSTHWDVDQKMQAIRIVDANDVVLRDFRVRMASEEGDAQPLLRRGIHVSNSSNVSIQGLELLGFPRTKGIVAINSGRGVSVEDNLFHGGYTVAPARQVTGIEVDDDRVNGDSNNLRIVGNFILGVMLDRTVFFDTAIPDRNGVPLGYETDGINMQVNVNPHLVANNSVMDVGEGIDTFSSNGQYRNNHIERAFSLGVKVAHGATGNRFSGNRVLATGLSSILVSDTKTQPTGSNAFIKNRIRFTNAFNVANIVPAIPMHNGIAAFHLMEYYTARNAFHLNEVSNPMFTDSSLWKGGMFCEWSAAGTEVSNANWSWKDRFEGFSSPVFNTNDGNCIAANTDAPLLASTSYEQWTADGVRVERNARPDVFGEQNTVDRIWSDISGAHEVRTSLSLGTWQNRDFTFSVLARRGTSSQLMLRDQVGDWLAIFELIGEGRVVSQSAGPLRSASVVPLTDDWYLLRVNFFATGPNVLLTLRQLSSGPGLFLDLGEARLDR